MGNTNFSATVAAVLATRLEARTNQIQRALQVLQQAQRYDLNPHGDFYQGEGMVHCESGDWIPIDDVAKAIQILQEGQQ